MINIDKYEIERFSTPGGEKKDSQESEAPQLFTAEDIKNAGKAELVPKGRFETFMDKYVIVENPKGSRPAWFSAKVAFWSTIGIGLLMLFWYLK